MNVSNTELAELIREIETADPIDYADLPFNENDLRLLVCTQVGEIDAQAAKLGEQSRQTVLLAVAAKLVLENLVLHIQLLRRHGVPLSASTDALLDRLRKGSQGG